MHNNKKIIDKLQLPIDIKKLNNAELEDLAEDIRNIIIDVCATNGGHLAPNLGVVELTIALLRIFNPLTDKIVWDVGHQCYSYKILTDRLNQFHTLRQKDGIAGFPIITESPYDAFGTGHSSTSISIVTGFAAANSINGDNSSVPVAIIGDGAMSSGLAFEGLNNLGSLNKKALVILNDNGMSISHNVGALSTYFQRIINNKHLYKLKQEFRNMVGDNSVLFNFLRKVEHSGIAFLSPGIVFEEMGFSYFGPIDGHNIELLESTIKQAKELDKSTLVHVRTIKGRGYKQAEAKPASYHGVSSFDINIGVVEASKPTVSTYNSIYGEKMLELARRDAKVVTISAAMVENTGLSKFQDEFPDRLFDVGIAESHAITFAGGLAVAGVRPYVVIYSTFLQRAYDNIIHDIALQKLPITVCIDRAGLVGNDGATHQGVFDIAYLLLIPNVVLFAVSNRAELDDILELSTKNFDAPLFIRYPKGCAEPAPETYRAVEWLKADVIRSNPKSNVIILYAGDFYKLALQTAEKLGHEYDELATIINIRFIKPLDLKTIMAHLENKSLIITIEGGAIVGGVGQYLYSEIVQKFYTNEHNLGKPLPMPLHIGVPDKFIEAGNTKEQYEELGFTPESISKQAKNILAKIISSYKLV